jgi:hypothetical protein
MLCSIATKLGQDQLDQIKAFEQDLDVTMLAFACHDGEPAEVADDQLGRIRDLERQLGVSLVAVRAA